MALLPEDARSQQRILGIALLVGAALLFHLYAHLPEREEIAALEERVATLEHANGMARIRTGDVDATQAELERGERLLAALQELVPATDEVASIYEAVAARGDALGLELVSVAPNRASAEEEGSYRRKRWDLVLEGRYHELGRFLTQVASLSRVVRPEVQSIEGLDRTSDGRYPVRAQLTLETFVQAEGAPPASRQSAAEPTAAADTAFRYDREMFSYPAAGRANPFRPPDSRSAAGPRFEDLRLSGILYGPSVGSVTVLRDVRTGRVHRLREGQRLGDARLVEVRPSEAVFAVAGPTGTRNERLRVKPDEEGDP